MSRWRRLLPLFLISGLALVGCDEMGAPTDGGAVDSGSGDAGGDGRLHCSAAMPTGCYEFSSGSCQPVQARCVDDYWVCTTPADYAEMMIACETM